MSRKPQKVDSPNPSKKLPRGIEFRSGAYRARKFVDGVSYRATFDTLADAQIWLKKIDVEKRADTLNPRQELKRMTFGELLGKFLAHKPDIHQAHANTLKTCMLSKMKLYDITSKEIVRFRDAMLKEVKEDAKGMPVLDDAGNPVKRYSKSTVVRRLNIISSVFSYGIAELKLPFDKNPALSEFVSRPENADIKRNRRVSKAELKALLRGTKKQVEKLIILFGYYQACRQSEIFALTWADVDLENRLFKLHNTKNMRYREVKGAEIRPLMPYAYRVLKAMQIRAKIENSNGKIFDTYQDAFKKRFYKLVKNLGFEDLHFHDLRHEATSQIAEIFDSPMQLRRITGHRDLKSLDRYYHPDLTRMAIDAEKRMRKT